MKIIENDTFGGFGLSPNLFAEDPNTAAEEANSIGLYQKCLNCQDYGVSCNGPKLAALGDIMVVREFHRAIKTARKITLKDIAAASPTISEYTVNDYFSHSVKDFKWTTVGVIDNALTAICGNRVGKPLLDHPCPATSSEIKQQREETDAQLMEAQAENQRLQVALEEAHQKRRDQRTEIKQEDQRKIDHLKDQVDYLEERCEYLKETAEKRYGLIVNRDNQIASLQKTASIWRTAFIFMLLIAAVLAVVLSMYLVWDYAHPGFGLIWK